MITLLLKESEDQSFFQQRHRQREGGLNFTSKESVGTKTPKSLSEEKENSNRSMDHYLKRMTELENRLEAIAHRGDFQEVEVVRPYPVEWDAAPYPLRFKALTLHTFDGKGSPNQHIYYFKFQTGNVVSNNAIMARLFIGTLKRVAFEWFMKLPAGSIKT